MLFRSTHESQKLPQPTGWRILILPFKMKEKTKGGILMGQDTLERQQVASQCANVLAVGPHAYQDKKRFPDGPWCKVGDWIMFARYAGSRIITNRMVKIDEIPGQGSTEINTKPPEIDFEKRKFIKSEDSVIR